MLGIHSCSLSRFLCTKYFSLYYLVSCFERFAMHFIPRYVCTSFYKSPFFCQREDWRRRTAIIFTHIHYIFLYNISFTYYINKYINIINNIYSSFLCFLFTRLNFFLFVTCTSALFFLSFFFYF